MDGLILCFVLSQSQYVNIELWDYYEEGDDAVFQLASSLHAICSRKSFLWVMPLFLEK